MEFKVGDRVVYPSQGVALIRDLVERKIGGVRSKYYVLEMELSDSTVLIPRDNVDQVGLRQICDKKTFNKLFERLREYPGNPNPNWKTRYKENLESMQSGDLISVGQVLKDLQCLSQKKTLGHREQKMMDQARHFLLSEISAVEKIRGEEADDRLSELLGLEPKQEQE